MTTIISTQNLPASKLREYNLVYTKDSDLNIEKKKWGKGYRYFLDGKSLTDKEMLNRVNSLVIPPAWNNVLISNKNNSHIQAIGYDDKNRKQYVYHDDWVKIRNETKFNRMIFFGEVLPTLRSQVFADMKLRGLPREKVIATIVWLLEHTFVRIGNEEYAKENETFGLSTLRDEHVEVRDNEVEFTFIGKSGIEHTVKVHDKRVIKVIHNCQELPDQHLFVYLNSDKSRHNIGSTDVNDYLKAVTGEDITAKDFRTWGGTVMAGDTFHKLGNFLNKTQAKKNISETVKKVSKHLRNTTTVCRNYYIHPRVITSYEEKILIPHFEEVYKKGKGKEKLHINEYATWTLLK